jgi:hypothetical protein
MFLAIEFLLAIFVFSWALVYPTIAATQFSAVEEKFGNFAQKKVLAVVSTFLLALGLRAALLPVLPIPVPQVDDEFSHLLLADTLAHGRLANPPHPMWVHFETFFVNWHPTYASMYYPGHALWLAQGQVVFGHPFWGVLLSSALMCAAICWALQGWMPPQWALLGAVLVVIRVGSFSYWADSYWGGSVAALGGALAFGAVPRVMKTGKLLNSLLLGLGFAILALTRPYEGLLFCIPLLVMLGWWALRGNDSAATKFVALAPALGIVAISLAWLGFYFYRVTGSPFVTPYQLNMREYGMIYFPWNHLKPVHFRHPGLETFYRGPAVVNFLEMARHRPLNLQGLKLLVLWLFYLGPVLTIPIATWLVVRPRKFAALFHGKALLLLATAAITYVAFALPFSIGQPHYIAPALVVIYAILLFVLRDLYRGSATTRFLARSVMLICLALFIARAAAPLLGWSPKPSWIRTWCSQDVENIARAKIQDEMENVPGNHLAIVRYAPNHNFILDEWVFNNADIDGSRVVWARDMGAQNAELVDYFRTRKVWLVEPDYNPPRLTPYAQ